MVSGPEVPQAAVAAVYDAAVYGSLDAAGVDAVLAAAWPHAGAAWLRWAAEQCNSSDEQRMARAWLRRLADEAEGRP